jgi:hypothetical protein
MVDVPAMDADRPAGPVGGGGGPGGSWTRGWLAVGDVLAFQLFLVGSGMAISCAGTYFRGRAGLRAHGDRDRRAADGLAADVPPDTNANASPTSPGHSSARLAAIEAHSLMMRP